MTKLCVMSRINSVGNPLNICEIQVLKHVTKCCFKSQPSAVHTMSSVLLFLPLSLQVAALSPTLHSNNLNTKPSMPQYQRSVNQQQMIHLVKSTCINFPFVKPYFIFLGAAVTYCDKNQNKN